MCRITNRTILFIVSVMLSLLLSSCQQGASNVSQPGTSVTPANSDPSAGAGDVAASPATENSKDALQPIENFRIGTNNFTEGLEATRTSNSDAQLQYCIWESLIMRDPYSEKLKLIPGLAQSWTKINDTTLEFKLRPNVKFHDGTVMDAEDVAFSLNRIFRKAGRDTRFDNAYGRYFNNFDKVEIIDSQTVHISTLRPDPLMEILLSDLSGAITSKEYAERVGDDEANLHPVGTGPYKVTAFEPSKSAVLERFDDYWGEKAPIRKVTFTWMPEVASRVTAIANNEIDMAIGIPTDQESALGKQNGVKLIDAAYPLYHVLVMNSLNEYMGNHKKLYQALDLAIDREALNKALWNGKGIVPTSLQFPDYGDMYLPDVKTVEYNPEKARQLVRESGYDGTTIVIADRSNYYVNMDLCLQAVIEMWKKIGVNAELRQVPDINKIPDPEVMIRTWSNPLYYPDPMGLIDASWSSTIWVSTRKLWQPGDEWFSTLDTARFSTDVQVRKDAIRKLNRIAKEQAGFILLYVPHEYVAVRDDISYKIPKNYRAYTISLRDGEIGRIRK